MGNTSSYEDKVYDSYSEICNKFINCYVKEHIISLNMNIEDINKIFLPMVFDKMNLIMKLDKVLRNSLMKMIENGPNMEPKVPYIETDNMLRFIAFLEDNRFFNEMLKFQDGVIDNEKLDIEKISYKCEYEIVDEYYKSPYVNGKEGEFSGSTGPSGHTGRKLETMRIMYIVIPIQNSSNELCFRYVNN